MNAREHFARILQKLVAEIVDFPDQVSVTMRLGDQTTVFEIHCDKADIGKVLGKQGRTVDALRILLRAYSTKHTFRGIIEVLE